MEEDFYCNQVLNGRIEVEKVLETDNILAFYHTKPFWETHIVVVPKRHLSSLLTIQVKDEQILLELIAAVKEIAAKLVGQKGAARILTNVGNYQDSKHLHFHVNFGDEIRKVGS